MAVLTSLWEWLDEQWSSARDIGGDPGDAEDPRPSGELMRSIEEAWGDVVLDRHPSVRVSSTDPFETALEVIEDAWMFWDSVHSAAVRYCRGGLGHTIAPVNAVRGYDTSELDDLDATVDAQPLIVALQEVQAASEPIDKWDEVIPGVEIQVRAGAVPRTGLEDFLSIISEHRRRWTKRGWDRHLEALWRRDHDDVLVAADIVRPTRRKTAEVLAPVATRWFGGDLGALGRAFALPRPLDAEHLRAPRRIPPDVPALREAVLGRLSGPGDDPSIGLSARRPSNRRREIADMAAEVLQLWEAKGRPPKPDEHGTSAFRAAEAFGLDRETAWCRYLSVLAEAAAALGQGHPPRNDSARQEDNAPHDSPREPVPHASADGAVAHKAERVAAVECDGFFYRLIVIGARVRGHPGWSRKRFLQLAAEGAATELEAVRDEGDPVDGGTANVRAARAARTALASAAVEYFRRDDIPREAVRETVGEDVFAALVQTSGGADAADRQIRRALGPDAWKRMLDLEILSADKQTTIRQLRAALTEGLQP
jgi:hypothetical protein